MEVNAGNQRKKACRKIELEKESEKRKRKKSKEKKREKIRKKGELRRKQSEIIWVRVET